jgi:hypothetical protein
MNHEHGHGTAVDLLLEKAAQGSVPPDVEIRLENRMQEFYRTLDSPPVRASSRTRIRRIVLFSLAAASILVVLAVSLGSQDAWAQVTKSIRSKPWVRLTLHVPINFPFPEGHQPPETWLSSEKQVVARRANGAEQFIDFARQETFEHRQDGTLWHSSARDSEIAEFKHMERLLRLVADGEQAFPLSDSPIEIVGRSQREVRDDDRRWIEFAFQCRDPRHTPDDYLVTFRVDPASRLPVEMRSTEKLAANDPAVERAYVIDYPESGPKDIYDLGVPRGVTVVDRRKAKTRDSNEIQKFLAEYQKAREKPIEPFSSYILETSPAPVISWVTRALRSNSLSEVEEANFEQLLELNQKVSSRKLDAPQDGRAEWWKSRLAELAFRPSPGGGQLLPDRIGYPVSLDAHLGGLGRSLYDDPVENPDCEVTLDRHPTSGPAGTVLLRIRTKPSETSLGSNDLLYWIAPEFDYIALRQEIHFSADQQPWNNATSTIDKVEKSPGGRWYATRARLGRVEKSGDELPDHIVRPMPQTDGVKRLRIEKPGSDRSADKIYVVKPDPRGENFELRPVSTTVFHFLVEFE